MNKSFSIVRVRVNSADSFTSSSRSLVADDNISELVASLESWRERGEIRMWSMTVTNNNDYAQLPDHVMSELDYKLNRARGTFEQEVEKAKLVAEITAKR